MYNVMKVAVISNISYGPKIGR